jgi:hypothetical protein
MSAADTKRSNPHRYSPENEIFGLTSTGSNRNLDMAKTLSAAFRREFRATRWNSMEPAMEEGTMWIAFFSIASAAAVCLSVAAVMIQAGQGDILSS